MLLNPSIDRADPKRPKLLTERVDPNATWSKRDACPCCINFALTDTEDPNLENARRDKPDPVVKNANTERLFPTRAKERIERLDPR
jgi:hypothetical protein